MPQQPLLDRIMTAIGARPRRGRDLEPGIYSYERLEGDWPTRFHLRVDPDEGGLLLANAAETAYLSSVGTRMARDVLEGLSDEDIYGDIRAVFRRASLAEMRADLAQIRSLIADLSSPGDNYPVTDLTDDQVANWSRRLAAPFRADVVQGDPRTGREILQRLWEVGIPHVTFLVRPEAPADDLPALIEAAEDLGMIAGLRATASWLSSDLIQRAALAGLDHLDLLYLSTDLAAHDELCGPGDHARVLAAFEQCHHLELCPVAQVPLYAHNTDGNLEAVFSALPEAGVTNLSFFALACPDDDAAAQAAGALPARALPQVALSIAEAAESTSARYLWSPPVRFDSRQPLAAQLLAGPRTAGDVSVRVEADGRVLPARGGPTSVGNVVTDAWEEIWGNECFRRYRERLQAPTRCADCPDLTICVADCPKNPEGWSDDTGEVGGRKSEVESERPGNAPDCDSGGEE